VIAGSASTVGARVREHGRREDDAGDLRREPPARAPAERDEDVVARQVDRLVREDVRELRFVVHVGEETGGHVDGAVRQRERVQLGRPHDACAHADARRGDAGGDAVQVAAEGRVVEEEPAGGDLLLDAVAVADEARAVEVVAVAGRAAGRARREREQDEEDDPDARVRHGRGSTSVGVRAASPRRAHGGWQAGRATRR
jgi:hypothetical protein